MKKLALLALAGLMVGQTAITLSASAYNEGYERAKLQNQQKRQQMQEAKINGRLDRVGNGPHAGYRRAQLENQQKRNAMLQQKTDHRLDRLDDRHEHHHHN